MNKIYEKWNSINLVLRILAGMIIGVGLGLLCPGLSGIAIPGTLFVNALKGIAPLLVFVLVISSIANAKADHKSNMGTVIMLYIASTILGAIVAVFAILLCIVCFKLF